MTTTITSTLENCTIHETLIIDTFFPYSTSIKPTVSVNYSFPGPLIEAYEGDTLVIRVINRLNVPSTIHWHGMHQYGTPGMDGSVGVSQCAIPPGDEIIYEFKAEPAGTNWYHGHLLQQHTDGLFGPLIIHPRLNPSKQYYDSDRIFMLSDWYNNLSSELIPWFLNPNNPAGIEPPPDAIVVNEQFTQSLFVPVLGAMRIRFRVINAAPLSMYTVSIDGLPLHIIELDNTETIPYSVNSFSIHVTQRVSFYIDLSELYPNYTVSGSSPTNSLFIRFQAVLSMYAVDILNYIPPYEQARYPYPTFFTPLHLGILSLDSTNSTPAYPAGNPIPTLQNAVTPFDMNILAVRPLDRNIDGIPNATHYLPVLITFAQDANGINRAYLNNVTFTSDANYIPTTHEPTEGITSDTYAPLLHQMARKPNQLGIPLLRIEPESQLPTIQSDGNSHYLIPYEAVVDIYLNNTDVGDHPFHMHGFTFWIIATSQYPEAEYLYHGNYIRRDVITVPASGWAKIRFIANNPGAWLLHCHIDWHMTAGMILVLIVSPEQLLSEGYTIPQDQKDLCHALQVFNTNNGTVN
ncbi:unnamed protein product [Rotaria socialis]